MTRCYLCGSIHTERQIMGFWFCFRCLKNAEARSMGYWYGMAQARDRGELPDPVLDKPAPEQSVRNQWICENCGAGHRSELKAISCCGGSAFQEDETDPRQVEQFEKEKEADARAGVVGYPVDLFDIFKA